MTTHHCYQPPWNLQKKCATHNHPCKLCRLLPSASLSNFSPIHYLFFLLFSPSLPLWVVTFMYLLWLDQPFVILGYTFSNHEWNLAWLLPLQWSCSIYLQNDHTPSIITSIKATHNNDVQTICPIKEMWLCKVKRERLKEKNRWVERRKFIKQPNEEVSVTHL